MMAITSVRWSTVTVTLSIMALCGWEPVRSHSNGMQDGAHVAAVCQHHEDVFAGLRYWDVGTEYSEDCIYRMPMELSSIVQL
ncbi:unnamed protein product [Peronospora belbahrii]|nr:unnamed protein product [Peronospora belbahrii]